jgi:V8-like Glu-specific endopeptidase
LASPARRRARLGFESLERREVLSLTAIPPNAGYPYSAVVELQATFPDHKTYVGTGALVDSFHVLTAGHVLYSYADGGFASQILAIPDLYGNYQPYGAAHMTYERTYQTFMNFNRAHPGQTGPGDLDIGLITLDRTIGNATGWFGFGSDNNNADFAAGTIYNTAGYPAAGGYDGRHMEFSAGRIAGLSSDGSDLEYYQSQITTFGGQSGSPVWRYTPANNSSVIYAVHIAGSGAANSLNLATRITSGIFNDLQNWRNADAIPRTPTQSALLPALAVTRAAAFAAPQGTPAPQGTYAVAQQGAADPIMSVIAGPMAALGDVDHGGSGHKARSAVIGTSVV